MGSQCTVDQINFTLVNRSGCDSLEKDEDLSQFCCQEYYWWSTVLQQGYCRNTDFLGRKYL